MKIDQLIYFIETAKTQHIGRAARILNISPSAISHSITGLEEELGIKLFEKHGKNIFLSAHGKKLVERVEPLLFQLNNIKNELKSDEMGAVGHFKMAVTHGLASRWITPLASRFQFENPGVSFEIYSLRSADVVEKVANGLVDLGICYSPQENAKIEILKIGVDFLRIAVGDKHEILKLPTKKQVSALSSYPAVSPKAFQGIEVCEDHPALKKAGINISTKLIFDSYEVACEAISTENYWGFIPEKFCGYYGLRTIANSQIFAEVKIAAVVPKSRPLDRFFKEFLESLKA